MAATNKPRIEEYMNLYSCLPFVLPCSKPAFKRHNAVVKDMEERKVSKLLFEDKEEGVKHVNKLWDVEEPGHVQSSQSFWIVRIVDRLASPAVATRHVKPAHEERRSESYVLGWTSLLPTLREAPEAEECLEDVVSNNNALDCIRRTVFHEPKIC